MTKVVGGVRVCLVLNQILAELIPREHINTHGSLVAFRYFWLLVKLIDGAVRIGVQDAKPRGFFHWHFNFGNGAGCVVLLMVSNHLGVVHLINVVTGKNHNIIRVVTVNKCDVLIDCVGGAFIPVKLFAVLVRWQNMYAGIHPV